MIKQILWNILYYICGILVGFYIVINCQKATGVVHNPNGYNVYTMSFLSQDFNYVENDNLSSIND